MRHVINQSPVYVPRQLKLIFFIPLLTTGCNWFQPTAYFFISNESKDKRVVDIRVSIADKSVFNDSIRYTDIRPDLQYTPYVTLPKGKYTIRVSADNGKATAEQPIDLGNDRWIFVTYSFSNPVDSTEAKILQTNFGFDTAFVNPKLRGSPPRVTVYIMDKEPVHM